MIEELSAYMLGEGYQRVATNMPGITFIFRQEMQSVNVILTIEYIRGVYITADQYRLIKQQMQEIFRQRGAGELHIMSLLIAENPEAARRVCEDDRFCWLIDSRCRQLMVCDGQVEDFYGLKRVLERFLGQYENRPEAEYAQAESSVYKRSRPREVLRTVPVITVILVCANILIYLICTWGTDVLYNIGELEGHRVLESGEVYRVLTSMFLHAGIDHLAGNMIALFFLGDVIEKALGSLRYVFLYMFSGIGAAIASVYFQYYTHDFAGSVGASGAIYGVLGAILFLIIAGKGRFQGITMGRMLMYLIYSFYIGFTSSNTDNAAHIGGLVCGFVLAALLTLTRKGTDRA